MTKVRISIRYKFLILISALLALCVFAYLGLATHVFSNDKKQLVYDFNRSFVGNLSSELEKLLVSSSNKMRLAAMLYLDNKQSHLMKQLFLEEKEIAFFSISEDFQNFSQELYWENSFFQSYGWSKESFLDVWKNQVQVPWSEIKQKASYVWKPAEWKDLPILLFSKVVFIENENSKLLKNLVVTSVIRLDRVTKTLFDNSLVQVDVFNESYQSLFSKSERQDAVEYLKSQIQKQTSSTSIQSGVFELKGEGDSYLAAYARVFDSNLLVFSTVSSHQAFSVVRSFLYRSGLFASIVITFAFMVAILFSRTLTRPLDTLMQAMTKVAKGDLGIKIRLKTQDETRVLAENFNRMISDLEKSRAKLVEINRDLEGKVKERTKKLEEQNKAVKDAQEALLKTSRLAAAGEIAGRAAHEVLNPLTSIMTRSQVLADRIRNKRTQELQAWEEIHGAWEKDLEQGEERLISEWSKASSLDPQKSLLREDIENLRNIKKLLEKELLTVEQDAEFLMEEGRRINKIVQSMRSLNRSGSELNDYEVVDLVQNSIHIMADAADKESIRLFMNKETSLNGVKVRVDKDEFIQSLTNLIRNSLQAIELAGEKTNENAYIKISLSAAQEDNVCIDIEDNGVGIRTEDKEKLFESNFSTKAGETGTGLGLSISRRFVRAFHGDLFLVNSVEGQGSHFRIQLPVTHWGSDQKESA